MINHARTPVLGVGVSAVNIASATDAILNWIERRDQQYVAVTGVHGVIEAQDDPAFKQLLNQSGLTVPDGRPLVWLAKLAGFGAVTQVTGLDLVLSVSASLGRAGGSAFYYGGAAGVADAMAATLGARNPGLRTAGTYCPPFRELTQAEEAAIARTINRSAPDVVWVGLSTPRQERWMARLRPRLTAPVLIGVGAAFDFVTGRIRRPPVVVQQLGLEWAYRLWQEPSRLWRRYLRNNPRFVYFLACEKAGLRDFGSQRFRR